MDVLPIDEYLPEIISLLQAHGSLVLTALPGAGKTTRVPPGLLEASLLPAHAPQILVLQPRRIAARAVAARIAEEQGWNLGEQVGYQVRMEKRLTTSTVLRIMTEGILTRQLLDDPALEKAGAIILDEFHERSIHSDLTLALLRQVRQTIRPDFIDTGYVRHTQRPESRRISQWGAGTQRAWPAVSGADRVSTRN